MPLGIDSSERLTALLMFLTVGIGVLGIFQELHRKDGKLTWLGWGLIVLICSLGVGTFFSGQRDRRLADAKEHADAAVREHQFQRQMRALSQLQRQMQTSLDSQRDTFGAAQQNLRLSATMQVQAQANTLAVLRRVFEESNRIAAERIAIGVTYQCPPYDRFRDSPRILEATLMVRGSASRAIRFATRQATQVGDGLVFHGFLGDLGRFETFPAWRHARISIQLSGGDISFGSMSLLEYSQLTEDELRRRENPDPVSCPTTAMLYLNGRQVLSASGVLTRRTRHRDYAAEFEDLRVYPRRLPYFSN